MNRFIDFNVDSVQFSIINTKKNVTVLDSVSPYTFTTFLKYTTENYTPVQYNDFFLFYLKEWAKINNFTKENQYSFIKEQYIELIKEISLNYTTNEEKKFLSNIDFNNPDDLEIAIPFYSNKLKDIAIYFKSQRDKIQLNTLNYKQRGTNSNIRKILVNNIIDYAFQNQTSTLRSNSYENITKFIDVEFEELIDTFGDYYNLSKTPSSTESELRQKYYSANYNKVDANIFINFDQALVDDVFRNVYLKELGVNFSINAGQVYDPFCYEDNPIAQLIDQLTVADISPTDKIKLRQKLIQKYIGTDLHYITRDTNNQILSGVLATASNPTGSFLNTSNPSTATVPNYDELVPLRKLGLYFSPDKIGLLKFDVRKKTYFINPDVVKANMVYVYPDPNVYGNVGPDNVLNENVYPVVYIFDYRVDIKNSSSSFSCGVPKVETRDQPFYAYFSNQQLIDYPATQLNEPVNLTTLYDKGYLYSFKTDIFGNQYGLYKNNYYRKQNTTINLISSLNLYLSTSPLSTLNKIISTDYGSFLDTPPPGSIYDFQNMHLKSITDGDIYIKNAVTNRVESFQNILSSLYYKYTTAVQTEVYNNVRQLDVFYNVIVIQTPNFLVFEVVDMDNNGSYIKTNYNNTYIQANSASLFSAFSNRIFLENENKVYFYVTMLYSDGYENDYTKIVYPKIYTYDIVNNRLQNIFDITTANPLLTSLFSHGIFKSPDGYGINLVRIDNPILSYNSFNSHFNITFTCKDLNNSPYIFNYVFIKDGTGVSFESGTVYDTQGSMGTGNNVIQQNLSYIQLLKTTINYYSALSSTSSLINVITSIQPDEQIFIIDQVFNSVVGTLATIDQLEGTLRI